MKIKLSICGQGSHKREYFYDHAVIIDDMNKYCPLLSFCGTCRHGFVLFSIYMNYRTI